MNFIQLERAIDTIAPQIIFQIGNFPISNSTLFIIFIIILISITIFFTIRKFSLNPKPVQVVFEIIYESIEDLLNQITGQKKYTEILYPFIGALFIFIGLSNLLGFIPGLTSITYNNISILRTPTADFNTTFSLALSAIIIIHLISIRDWGLFGHLGKFFKFKEVYFGFKKSISDGFVSIIDFLIGLLDIIGEIAKIISLSLRLFGNLYAGIVLATVIMGAFAYFVPVIWTALGILFGVVQAVVFGALVTAYYMMAIKIKEDEEKEDEFKDEDEKSRKLLLVN